MAKSTQPTAVNYQPEAEAHLTLPKAMEQKYLKGFNPRLKDTFEVEIKGTIRSVSLDDDGCRVTLKIDEIKVEEETTPESMDGAIEKSRKYA